MTESVQQRVDCVMVTNYNPILFEHFVTNMSLFYTIIAIKHDFLIH